jgi:hypothetical protein
MTSRTLLIKLSIFAAYDQTQHSYTHIFNTGAKDKDQSVSSENKSLSSCHTHIYGPSEILHKLKKIYCSELQNYFLSFQYLKKMLAEH